MHETAIARNIIQEAEKHGNVNSLDLEIGELAHVPAQELISCLRQLVKWKISFTEKPSTVKCACGYAGHPKIIARGHDHFMIECPKCKKIPQLTDGTEIIIKSVEVE